MAKKLRGLLAEIDKKFKESEEVSIWLPKYLLQGIDIINGLQGKLVSAST